MMKQPKLSNGLTGVAGEYFVGAELSRRGYVASMTLRNTRGIDILASNEDNTKSIGIQVKTSQGRVKKWVFNAKVEQNVATNLCFVLVCLNGLDVPQYHIVPRADVVACISADHLRWINTPGRKGQLHNENRIRKFADLNDKYLGRWELLELD